MSALPRVSRRAALVVAVPIAVAVAGVAAYGLGGGSGAPPQTEPDATKTIEVSRMDLVDYEEAPGEIGYGSVTTLRYTPPPSGGEGSGSEGGDGSGSEGGNGGDANVSLGLLTWLPPVGSTVDRGQAVFRVDDAPVVLLIGTLPVYRTLRAGVAGADVRQFEENLVALGESGFTVDDQYTDATATAVRRWQKSLGLPQTGEIAPGRVLYAAGPVRIADHRLRVGDVATGDIVGVTGTTRVASAEVNPAALGHAIEVGTAVTLLFRDGGEVPATVRSVTPVPPEPGAPQTVLVEAEVADQALLADREGSATMRFVAAERRDVLAVPVVALVALAEGGYGVQVVDGATTRYVAVETGLFARGYVEIVSGDLRPGMRIVVPS